MNNKNTFLILIIFIFSSTNLFSQQYCIPGRFDTSYYFNPLQIDTAGNIVYGINTDYQNNVDTLKYIIAYPKNSVDPLNKRPFVLLIHGGGFLNGDKYDMKLEMIDFAMKGYVCASIDYRLGWQTNGDPFNCLGSGYSLAKAVYRALQDAKASLRYFSANANLYKIDTAFIFVGGVSAGGVTSLMISYANQQDINSVYPNLRNELGPLDSVTNTYTNNFTLKSALSVSGGLFDTVFIKQNTKVASLLFHGTADTQVPYGAGYAFSCTNYVQTEGSNLIRTRLRNLHKPFEFDYVPGGGHATMYPLTYIQLRSTLFLKRYLCNNARQIIIENYTTLFDSSLGTFTGNILASNESVPNSYKLYQNFPNPFNPTTRIKFSIPSGRNQNFDVRIRIYDILGKEVAKPVNGKYSTGEYIVDFDGTNLTSGVYFYRLDISDPQKSSLIFKDIKRMLLIK